MNTKQDKTLLAITKDGHTHPINVDQTHILYKREWVEIRNDPEDGKFVWLYTPERVEYLDIVKVTTTTQSHIEGEGYTKGEWTQENGMASTHHLAHDFSTRLSKWDFAGLPLPALKYQQP